MEKRRNVVNHRTTEYQYGSAVRKLQSVPEIHTYEHERRIEEQEQERRQRRREIRRNNRVNLVYTTVLAICATAVFAICYQYLNLQSDIKTNSTAVVELQNQLNSLKAENNSHESEINAGIDYNAFSGWCIAACSKCQFNIFYLDFLPHATCLVGCAENFSYICRLRL